MISLSAIFSKSRVFRIENSSVATLLISRRERGQKWKYAFWTNYLGILNSSSYLKKEHDPSPCPIEMNKSKGIIKWQLRSRKNAQRRRIFEFPIQNTTSARRMRTKESNDYLWRVPRAFGCERESRNGKRTLFRAFVPPNFAKTGQNDSAAARIDVYRRFTSNFEKQATPTWVAESRMRGTSNIVAKRLERWQSRVNGKSRSEKKLSSNCSYPLSRLYDASVVYRGCR